METVDRDLRKILINPNAQDPFVVGVRLWPQAIPQFLVGHLDLLDVAKASIRNTGFEGLFLGGNYVSGVAFYCLRLRKIFLEKFLHNLIPRLKTIAFE